MSVYVIPILVSIFAVRGLRWNLPTDNYGQPASIDWVGTVYVQRCISGIGSIESIEFCQNE